MILSIRRCRLVWVGMVGPILIGAAGCAASPGRVAYDRHVSHRIDPGPATNTDLSFAFGLDGLGDQGEAVARGRHE